MYVELQGSSDRMVAWQNQGIAFGALFGLQYKISSEYFYDINEVSILFYETGSAPCAPIVTWGQCDDPGPYKTYWIAVDRAEDAATIRRALASWFLGPSPLPGLMNAVSPAEHLSALEEQTIRMMLLRPRSNRWPDIDR